MNQPSNNVLKTTSVLLLFLIAINLIILDFKVFSPPPKISDIAIFISPTPATSDLSKKNYPQGSNSASIFPSPSSPPVSPNNSNSSNFLTSNTPAEYYIPLGGGTTSQNTYQDLTTTDTLIDTSGYGNITSAYFVAGLSNPTQNGFVQAQLYNVTDKHPVWNSTITLNNSASGTITSNPITLDSGPKLYRIQLLSSLQYPGTIENAKIRIVTE